MKSLQHSRKGGFPWLKLPEAFARPTVLRLKGHVAAVIADDLVSYRLSAAPDLGLVDGSARIVRNVDRVDLF